MSLRLAVLTLVIMVVGACASLTKPSIEQSIRDLRAACELAGEPDLDACAEKLARAAR